MVLRRVGVLSAGKVVGVIYVVFGLFVGVIMALMALAGAAMPQQPNQPGGFMVFAGMGIASIIIFPIMYGVMGFIGGVLSAAIYNLVAGVIGGLELDFERQAGYVAPPQ